MAEIKQFEMVKAVMPYKTYPNDPELYTEEDPKQLLENEYIKFNAGAQDEVKW